MAIAAIDSLRPAREIGPRLTGAAGHERGRSAPMPAVFGRARIAGR
jgi:hypothetical protein